MGMHGMTSPHCSWLLLGLDKNEQQLQPLKEQAKANKGPGGALLLRVVQ